MQRLAQSRDLQSFLVDFEDIVDALFQEHPSASSLPSRTSSLSAELYSALIADLDAIGWDRIASLDETMTRMEIALVDDTHRTHTLKIQLPKGYPVAAPVCSLEMPVPLNIKWNPVHLHNKTSNTVTLSNRSSSNNNSAIINDTSQGYGAENTHGTLHMNMNTTNTNLHVNMNSCSSLNDVVKHCMFTLNSFAGLWDVLDDWDNNTKVLDPPGIRTKGTHRHVSMRRIATGHQHCSLQVDIDWRRPRAVCECKFFGSDSVVGALFQTLNDRLYLWNQSLLPRENLQLILGLQFPPSPTDAELASAAVVEQELECGVCYSHYLDNSSMSTTSSSSSSSNASSSLVSAGSNGPDCHCENAKCNKSFHKACLYEWMTSLPNTRLSFNVVYSVCPYCTSPFRLQI
jgi:E3 ubiquitin-protein ligase FANCL